MKPHNFSITAIIIAKNEAGMIANCIETLRWCDQVVVVDNHSTDNTASLATQLGAKVVSSQGTVFNGAQMRNLALKYIKTDWILYIDADERVTPKLAEEIKEATQDVNISAGSMTRQNIMYGRLFKYGGWQSDTVTRLFRVGSLEGWQGDVHESPLFKGEVKSLETPLLHLTHRNTIDGVEKTVAWTPIEAQLLADSGIAKVKFSTLIRKGFMEFFRRAVLKKGYKDGEAGWIEALVQGINRILVYIQVWEHQQEPSLEKKYKEQEEKIADLWKESDNSLIT